MSLSSSESDKRPCRIWLTFVLLPVASMQTTLFAMDDCSGSRGVVCGNSCGGFATGLTCAMSGSDRAVVKSEDDPISSYSDDAGPPKSALAVL